MKSSNSLPKAKKERIERILKEVLKEIQPSPEIKKKIQLVKNKVEAEIKKQGVDCDCFIGGSIGKDTFLDGDFDCDLFLRFAQSSSEEEINKLSKRILAPFKPDILRGSREYFSFVYQGIDYEVIPVFRISEKEKAKNSIDYSPLHVKWVTSHSKYKNDIRLAKRFCKAQKVYGAESYRNGLSGHAVEIITIFYKGFLNLVKAVSNWSDSTVIDVENRYKGVNPALMLDEAKLGPLVLVDPVTPHRNAAAAFSKEKYDLFITACKNFLKKPSKEMFNIEFLSPQLIKSRHHKKGNITFIFKHLVSDKGSPDKIGTRMYKEYQRLLRGVKKSDFSFIGSDWDWDGGDCSWSYIQVKDETLPSEKAIEGPPSMLENHAKRFKEAHSTVFEKNGRLYAREKREFREPVEFINYFMKKVLKYQKETLLFDIIK